MPEVEKASVTAEEAAEAAPAEEATERPEWLPEKFESPEAMAAAYGELESKLGAGDPAPADEVEEDVNPDEVRIQESEEEIEATTGLDFDAVTAELAENGELSDETYERFEQAGIDRSRLDLHIEGMQALAERETRKLTSVVGGQENLNAILEWAGGNIPKAQADRFNQAMDERDYDTAELALRGIAAQYHASEGVEPRTVTGAATGPSSGVKPFKSSAEVTEAMSDPRYKTDPEYIGQVEERLSVSPVFGG